MAQAIPQGTGMVLINRRRRALPGVSIPNVLLLAFIVCLAIAGGASRADALGQAIVRPAAAAAIAVLLLAHGKPSLPRWPMLILVAAMALPLLQLIPLPPSIWPQLPGRQAFLAAAQIADADQPWRPIALSPGAAWNALFSLLIPAAALSITASLDEEERAHVPGIVFGLAGVSAGLAVLQLSGGGFDNPLINEPLGAATGVFANPNHQALLLAVGILGAAAWAAGRQRSAPWRVLVAGGSIIFFILMIMASGSRTGLMLGFLALGLAVVMAKRPIAAVLMKVPPRVRAPLIMLSGVGIVGLAIASFTAGRAVSLNRLLVLSTGEDMRSRALPTVLDLIGRYMPFGSGFGSFDPVYRMREPDDLLGRSYFNHAHSDFLEVALEGGVLAVVLVAIGIAWSARAGVLAWRTSAATGRSDPAARFAASAILLIALASLVDYPLRTPTVMALLAIAAVLVGSTGREQGRGALRLSRERVERPRISGYP